MTAETERFGHIPGHLKQYSSGPERSGQVATGSDRGIEPHFASKTGVAAITDSLSAVG